MLVCRAANLAAACITVAVFLIELSQASRQQFASNNHGTSVNPSTPTRRAKGSVKLPAPLSSAIGSAAPVVNSQNYRYLYSSSSDSSSPPLKYHRYWHPVPTGQRTNEGRKLNTWYPSRWQENPAYKQWANHHHAGGHDSHESPKSYYSNGKMYYYYQHGHHSTGNGGHRYEDRHHHQSSQYGYRPMNHHGHGDQQGGQHVSVVEPMEDFTIRTTTTSKPKKGDAVTTRSKPTTTTTTTTTRPSSSSTASTTPTSTTTQTTSEGSSTTPPSLGLFLEDSSTSEPQQPLVVATPTVGSPTSTTEKQQPINIEDYYEYFEDSATNSASEPSAAGDPESSTSSTEGGRVDEPSEEVDEGNDYYADYDYSGKFPPEEKAFSRKSSGQAKGRQLLGIGRLLKTRKINSQQREEDLDLMPVYKPDPKAMAAMKGIIRKKRSISPLDLSRIANLAELSISTPQQSRINFDFVGSQHLEAVDRADDDPIKLPTTAVWGQPVRNKNKLPQLAKTDENTVETSLLADGEPIGFETRKTTFGFSSEGDDEASNGDGGSSGSETMNAESSDSSFSDTPDGPSTNTDELAVTDKSTTSQEDTTSMETTDSSSVSETTTEYQSSTGPEGSSESSTAMPTTSTDVYEASELYSTGTNATVNAGSSMKDTDTVSFEVNGGNTTMKNGSANDQPPRQTKKPAKITATSPMAGTSTTEPAAMVSGDDEPEENVSSSVSAETSSSDIPYSMNDVLSSLSSIVANAMGTTEMDASVTASSTTAPVYSDQTAEDDGSETAEVTETDDDNDDAEVIGISPGDNEFISPSSPYVCPPFDVACKSESTRGPVGTSSSASDLSSNTPTKNAAGEVTSANSQNAVSSTQQQDKLTTVEYFRTEVYASVETRQGRVLGKEIQPREATASPYYAFMGLPYAEPPVDDLRFRPPTPHHGWTGTWNGTVTRPKCIQYEIFKSLDVVGQEDCLYLNVYTPKLPEKMNDASLPVLFYIPGGFFTSASADPEDLNPAALMAHNVVVVTVNYRLGPLGFLSTEDDEAPGNYGLQDVILALKWVYTNIRYFGGDKAMVTVGGYGSGASLAHLAAFVPGAGELLSGLILQGGSALSAGALTKGHKAATQGLAKNLGCNTSNASSLQVLTCLKKQKASSLVRAARSNAKWQIFPLVFTPRIDLNLKDSVIPYDPRELMDKGQFCRVPMLAGFPKDIGLINTFTVLSVPDPYLTDLNANWSRICPYALQLDKSGCECDRNALCRVIRKQYFGSRDIDLTTAYDLTNLMGDRWFKQATLVAAEKHSKHAEAYVYVHNYEPEGGFKDVLFGGVRKSIFNISKPYTDGAFYGDDLLALFPPDGLDQKSTTDSQISQLVVQLWANFLKQRRPVTGSGQPFLSWPKYTEDDRRFYVVDNPPRQSTNPVTPDSFKFWDFVSFIAGDV